MNLTKIIIKSVRADKAVDLVKSLKELPDDIVKGNYSEIDASQINGEIYLSFLFNEKKDLEESGFNLPKGSENSIIKGYGINFDYNKKHYLLDVKITPDGP